MDIWVIDFESVTFDDGGRADTWVGKDRSTEKAWTPYRQSNPPHLPFAFSEAGGSALSLLWMPPS